MKIFGINFTTKREKELQKELVECLETLEELEELKEDFPFTIGQVVYDVQLKNSKGRYAKANPSFEHSTISEVAVSRKNYFSLVERYENNDVFTSYDDAEAFLKERCAGKK